MPSLPLRGLALLAVVAALLSRAVAPALPGTASGLDVTITVFRRLAAVTSAYFFVSATVLLIWFALAVLASTRLPTFLRVAALPMSSTVVVVSIAATLANLEPRWLLWIGVCSGLIALVGAPHTLATPRTRAVGLVLALVGTTAMVEVVARVLALRASEAALVSWFQAARAIATLTFGLQLAALFVLALWIGGRRPPIAAVGAMAVALVAAFFTGVGARGTFVDASTFEILVARSFGELARHPQPFVPVTVVHAVEVSRYLLAAIAVLLPGRSHFTATALALAALAVGNTDIPACAVMLSLAALLAPLDALGAPEASRAPAAQDAPALDSSEATPAEAVGAPLSEGAPADDAAASDAAGGGAPQMPVDPPPGSPR